MASVGISGQFVSLAVALRLALDDYQTGVIPPSASMVDRIEIPRARAISVVLLNAALCEATVNHVLSLQLSAADFAEIDRRRTVDKWSAILSGLWPDSNLPETLKQELEALFACRNAIMHPVPQVSDSTGATVQPGNLAQWRTLDDRLVQGSSDLVLRLLQHYTRFEFSLRLQSDAIAEHLMKKRQTATPVKIACLGWGSLIWDPRNLPLVGGWHNDGPTIRVEYLWQLQDDRLTLVLHATAPAVPGLWVQQSSPTLAAAKADLAVREQIPAGNIARDIGAWSAGDADPATIPRLGAWAVARGLWHVVWTALRPKFNGVNGAAPTQDQALAHWSGLTSRARDRAEQYVRRTPRQVDTPYRRAAMASLGWTAAE